MPLLSRALTSAFLSSSHSGCAEKQSRILLEQRFDLFQVASPDRVMNLAAAGEAVPGQSDQYDGSKAKN
jgi:hypothetical protein